MAPDIVELSQKFNALIRPAIEGPNCIDRSICDGNCCFIHIDIPRALAEYFIQNGNAKPDDFARGSIFSFEIKVDLEKLRCVFYDPELNGCLLHNTGAKPPQCWVYPTGLDPETAKDTCKKAKGWRIIDPDAVKEAEEALQLYVSTSRQEAEEENSPEAIGKRLENLEKDEFEGIKPSAIAGVEDNWEKFNIFLGEGYNFGMRLICDPIACGENYFECPQICESALNSFLEFVKEKIPKAIMKDGFKREYILMELKDYE